MTMYYRLQERSLQKKPYDDNYSVFGKMLVNELRSLQARLKIMLKHDISYIIFKYQIKNVDESQANGNSYACFQPFMRNITTVQKTPQ